MRFVQAKMGVSPGWGGGVKLVQLVGRKKALELLLKAQSIDVNNALEYGLVDGKLEDGMVGNKLKLLVCSIALKSCFVISLYYCEIFRIFIEKFCKTVVL